MAEHEMDFQKIMGIYKCAGALGNPHKLLAKLEGSWTTRSKGWMEPGKPPRESIGTCEQRLILDGRFLRQEYTGDMGGTPFTGINFLGYNNHTNKYVSVWLESTSTAIYYFEGIASADGKTITQECCYDDPVRGLSVWKSVSRFKDDNTIEFEMYLIPKDGKEEKMMEMTISRKGAAERKAA